jgi:hypothetical protein
MKDRPQLATPNKVLGEGLAHSVEARITLPSIVKRSCAVGQTRTLDSAIAFAIMRPASISLKLRSASEFQIVER